MSNNKTDGLCLEDVLIALGADKPFDDHGKLTFIGSVAYDKLRAVVGYLRSINVIDGFDEDRLDRVVNGKYY